MKAKDILNIVPKGTVILFKASDELQGCVEIQDRVKISSYKIFQLLENNVININPITNSVLEIEVAGVRV